MPLACTAIGTLQILDWRLCVALIVCSGFCTPSRCTAILFNALTQLVLALTGTCQSGVCLPMTRSAHSSL